MCGATWAGMAYVAFIIDVFSRRIVGWKADTSMKTALVLDTLEMAFWTRHRDGSPVEPGLIHHHDNGLQYLSFAFTQRLIDEGIDASAGSVGDGYDTQSGPWCCFRSGSDSCLRLSQRSSHRPVGQLIRTATDRIPT